MWIAKPCKKREESVQELETELCIVGGGFAGACAAITAARNGVKVVLIHDRPVLGGNASNEIRMWVLGATSHMGNNDRWALEGGLPQELFLENLWRNKEGNPYLWDMLLHEKVQAETNITVLLNTAVFAADKKDADTIKSVTAFNSQTATFYKVSAPLFVDSSGDGILGFLTGAAFRMGMESKHEFGELYAPEEASTDVLGSSIMFTVRDMGRPIKFTPPSFALSMEEVEKISKFRPINLNAKIFYWWIEFGGVFDTIKKSEDIKEELWRVAYGIWNYIKNSGKYPQSENLTLDWVSNIPGKRESRRFEGDYMLIQQDVIEQRFHYDDVSYGGWALDHHPADGLYSEQAPCVQWHSKGVYTIPYRTMYSRNIKNLFLAGRIISCSHVAFGTTRVQSTCGHSAQAVGIAAAMCLENKILPRDVSDKKRIKELQTRLVKMGAYIPGIIAKDAKDIAQSASVKASSTLKLEGFKENGEFLPLEFARAMMLPLKKGMKAPKVSFLVKAAKNTVLRAELKAPLKPFNHTPEKVLSAKEIAVKRGVKWVEIDFSDAVAEADEYVFAALMPNKDLSVALSDERVTGILSVGQKFNPAVAASSAQIAPDGIGIDSFEFWLPERRPAGKNLAMKISPAIDCFAAENVLNGIARPVSGPNAWVAKSQKGKLTLSWDKPKKISQIYITFDSDYDHPLEQILMGHPENAVPFCARDFTVKDAEGNTLCAQKDWHNALKVIKLEKPITTKAISIDIKSTWGAPAAIFEVRAY